MAEEEEMAGGAAIRLVAIDLDGTLLDNEGQLPPRGSRLIKMAYDRGVRVVAVHARSALRAVERTGFLEVVDQMPRRQEPTTLRLMPGGAVDRQVNLALAVARRGEHARICGVRGEHARVSAGFTAGGSSAVSTRRPRTCAVGVGPAVNGASTSNFGARSTAGSARR